MSIPGTHGLVVDRHIECTSNLTYSPSDPERRNTSMPSGVNIFVKFNNFQDPNTSIHQGLDVTNGYESMWTASPDLGAGSMTFDPLRGSPICISFGASSEYDPSSTDDLNLTASCYQNFEYSIAARMLYNVSPAELQFSLNGAEWISVCNETDLGHTYYTLAMICEDLGYQGVVVKSATILHENYDRDSIIALKCPTSSSRIRDCQATRGRCESHQFIALTCQNVSHGFEWSIFNLSLIGATAGLFFMLVVSLIVHLCRCCGRKHESEVLVTFVKRKKSSIRDEQAIGKRPANTNTLLQLPAISYDNADEAAINRGSSQDNDFMSSAEGIYMDIPDRPFIRSNVEALDQAYQTDEDGYAKPRNVIETDFAEPSVTPTPMTSPMTNHLTRHVTGPVTSTKPTPLSRHLRYPKV